MISYQQFIKIRLFGVASALLGVFGLLVQIPVGMAQPASSFSQAESLAVPPAESSRSSSGHRPDFPRTSSLQSSEGGAPNSSFPNSSFPNPSFPNQGFQVWQPKTIASLPVAPAWNRPSSDRFVPYQSGQVGVSLQPATQPSPKQLFSPGANLLAARSLEQSPTAIEDYVASEKMLPDEVFAYASGGDEWSWQVLPKEIIYKSYLAGMHEPRMGMTLIDEKDEHQFFDGWLGGRVGFIKFGPKGKLEGFQLDFAGVAAVRLDPDNELDVSGTDYLGSVPLTYGWGNQQVKLMWYHLSSHVGDEFTKKNPMFQRVNFSRDVLVLGYSIYPEPNWRLYAEAGFGYNTDVTEPWEFQFGVDYAPAKPTGFRGAPFFAINAHLREELHFGGNMVFQTGWAWRAGNGTGRLLRIGLHYYNGGSSQFSYYDNFEQQIGWGLWYDF